MKELTLQMLYEALGLEKCVAPAALVELNTMCLKACTRGTCPLKGGGLCDCYIQRAVNEVVKRTGIDPRPYNFELQITLKKGGELHA